MNHLEQLVAEWLQFNGYFVRCAVQVGKRARGGFEGELDVVGIHIVNKHMLHVECSLDADSIKTREQRFAAKFERGRKFKELVFPGLALPETLEQVVVHQFPNKNLRKVGGARLVTVKELIHEIYAGLEGTSPSSGAVPSNLPLLRTLQLAAYAGNYTPSDHKLISRPERPA